MESLNPFTFSDRVVSRHTGPDSGEIGDRCG